MGKSIIFYILIFTMSACSATYKTDLELYLGSHKSSSVELKENVKKAFDLYRQRDVLEAFKIFKKIVKVENKDTLVMFKYGFLLSKTGNEVEAIRVYKFVSDNINIQYPGHNYVKRVWINLGNLSFRHAKFEEALKYYKKGYELGDRSKDIYYSLGMVYRRLEKYSLAAAYMEKADLSKFRVNFYLSAIYYELKKIDAALKRIDISLSINGNDTRALGSKGNFLYIKAETMEKRTNIIKMNEYLYKSADCYKKAIANGGNLYTIHLKNVYAKLKKYRNKMSKKLKKVK